MDLASGKSRELFDFLDTYNPVNTKYVTGDDPTDKKFVQWGHKKVDFDFLHINAVDIVKGQGVLVSLRNANKLVMLDSKFREIKWSLGRDRKDTYRIADKSGYFEHAHSPFLIDDDKILLFDNGVERKSSRIVVYELGTKSARMIFDFTPKPTLYSKNRSSVFPLENDRVLALFVSPGVAGNPPRRVPNIDIAMEIDLKTGKKVAEMEFHYNTLSPGYRAIPMQSIGREKYWGPKLSAQKGRDIARRY